MLNVLLTGVGGQGTVLAAKILAQAAQSKGWQVRTAETIGMAQRGGSVMSHVRIGDCGEEVHAPLVLPGTADVIIAFEPGEAARALPYLGRATKDELFFKRDQLEDRSTTPLFVEADAMSSSNKSVPTLITARSVVQPVTSALSTDPYRSDEILRNIEKSLETQQNVSRETFCCDQASDVRSLFGGDVSRETSEDLRTACERANEGRCAENVSRETLGARLVVVDDGVYADKLGTSRMLNTILLASAVKERCLPITRYDLEEAINACVKPRFLDLNLAAISLVFDGVKER